uniref:glucan endo-1,3-beta-D-glucosidase n=1 Tax=Vitis vinifera TaxID=29760 RepID=F6GWB7_VITVI
MALTRNKPLVVVLLLGFVIMSTLTIGAQSIGVCYGTNGNNLPSASQVINLYKSNGIGSMRIYDPNSDTLQALKGSGIELILDVPNTSLQSLASDASAASTWVQNNVVNYASDVKFRYIAVGNEVLPTGSNAQYAQYVLPAMKNVQSAITSAGLQGQIKVSTATYSSVLGTSYPPSAGSFSSDASSFINPIISFLAENGSPLLANIYPYFSYTGDTQNIRLDYALFTASGVVVQDGSYQYQNLFDAFGAYQWRPKWRSSPEPPSLPPPSPTPLPPNPASGSPLYNENWRSPIPQAQSIIPLGFLHQSSSWRL